MFLFFKALQIVSIKDELKIIQNLRPGKLHKNYTGNDCAWHPLEGIHLSHL